MTLTATIEELDRAEQVAASFDTRRLALLRTAISMCERESWQRSGSRTLATWLAAYTGMELPEARRFARLARLAYRHPALASAVFDDKLSYGRAELLAGHASGIRETLLADSLDTLLAQSDRLHRFDEWARLVNHWTELVDQELSAPPRSHRHEVHLSQTLFGGGEIHGWLDPEALVTIAAGLDAFMPTPDPTNSPLPPRTPAQRRADALTDMAAWGLGGEHDDLNDSEQRTEPDDYQPDDNSEPDDDEPEDFEPDGCESDGGDRTDSSAIVDRRTTTIVKRRSTVTANVIIDLRTMAGDRRFDDLDGFDLRSDRWRLTRSVAEQLICDAGLVATLIDGHRTVLDASDRSEQFTIAQRRALAVRDRGCVFPGCDRPPKHTDAHHLRPRATGGTDRVDDGALNCRYHHRLLHRGWQLHFDTVLDRWIATDPEGIEWHGRPRGSPHN